MKQRNKKIIRKLSNSYDEIENLYNFVKNFKIHDYNLYEYQNLMKYVNSYIVEKNSKIFASMNLIQIDKIYIAFDFFCFDIQDLFSLIQFVLSHLNRNITFIIFDFPQNHFDTQSEDFIHQSILKILNSKEYWIDWDSINSNESLYLFIDDIFKKYHYYNNYILKKFYNNFISNIMKHKISKFQKMALQ